MTMLIHLRQTRTTTPNIADLKQYLSQLIGEPFQLARVSYGEELTLHFGELRAARSPKLQHLQYGSYILGVRASSWILKSGSQPVVLSSDDRVDATTVDPTTILDKKQLEANPTIQVGSHVTAAIPFLVNPNDTIGLQLLTSDGSRLVILPTPPQADESGEESLPEIADWELATPRGLLSVGPGLSWAFQPNS